MTDPSPLRALADRVGILPDYRNNDGTVHETTDETRNRLLDAMGFDVPSDDAARTYLDRLDRRRAEQIVEPLMVVSTHDPAARRVDLVSRAAPVRIGRVTVTGEDGIPHQVESSADSVALPALGLGEHTIAIEGRTERRDFLAHQRRIVHPGRCYDVRRAIGTDRRFGVWANVYALRSERNWGVGDLGDVRSLARGVAPEGAAFVGLNPLHALPNIPPGVSPYYPWSRIFRNPLYLDLEAMPEWEGCPEARVMLESTHVRRKLRTWRETAAVAYAEVWEFKLIVLKLLHGVFERQHRDTDTVRGRRFRTFVERHGARLEEWAGWMTERQPDTTPTLHTYLQFAIHEQLADVAEDARSAGLDLGLYHDLAVGVAPDGADVALFPDLFVRGATIGAPPDAFSDGGQDWSVHPVNPLRSRETGHRYWREILAAGMTHAGMLRIDHVMGLERQFWIPEGCPAREGAYVQYPASDWFGLLALESERRRVVVVGESLGTLPEGFLDRLRAWGVLSSQVMYFEREPDGDFRRAGNYSDHALVAINTHDLPTWNGFWTGHDLEQREDLGLLEGDALAAERSARERDRQRLLVALDPETIEGGPRAPSPAVAPRVTEFLGRTPAPLLGLAFDDLAGEVDPVNVPGAPPGTYAPWARRNRRMLTEALESPLARETFAAARRSGRVRGADSGESGEGAT